MGQFKYGTATKTRIQTPEGYRFGGPIVPYQGPQLGQAAPPPGYTQAPINPGGGGGENGSGAIVNPTVISWWWIPLGVAGVVQAFAWLVSRR
jgi:hypothetical protein